MRVSTPGRHCSGGAALGSLTFMEFGPFALLMLDG